MTATADLGARDLYARLGLDRTASRDEVKRAYLTLLRRYTPERHPEEFKRIREAYEVLYDPTSRRDYDEQPDPGVQAAINAGMAAMDAKDYAAAEQKFKQTLVQAPHLDYVRNLLGLCFLYQEQPEKAVQQYERLLVKDDAPACVYGNAGHAYRRIKRYPLAETCFSKAIHIGLTTKQDVADYVLGLVDTFLEQDKVPEARGALDRAAHADGVLDFEDLRYFLKLMEIALRERDQAELHRLLGVTSGLAQDEQQRHYVGWRLGVMVQHCLLAALPHLGLPIAAAATQLQPGDRDYPALAELCRILMRGDYARARRFMVNHPAFGAGEWLGPFQPRLEALLADASVPVAAPRPVPISGAPPLFTLNGFGTRLAGRRDVDAATGEYTTTLWICALFIPLIPLASYRVRDAGEGRYRFVGKVQLGGGATALLTVWVLVAIVALIRGYAPQGAGDRAIPPTAAGRSTTFDSAWAAASGPAPTAATAPAPTAASPAADRAGGAIDTALFAVTARDRVASRYAGGVKNFQVPGPPATLQVDFVVHENALRGTITIGAPLEGSGPFEGFHRGDSLVLISRSALGDTILWRSAVRDSIYFGDYSITGGRFRGQGGRWAVKWTAGQRLWQLPPGWLYIRYLAEQLESRPKA